jgi:hypothetical protein
MMRDRIMFRLSNVIIGSAARHLLAGSLIILLLGQSMPALCIELPPGHSIPESEFVIPEGTELSVVTMEEISSKTATEGDPVTFKVEDDVVINNQVVIARGTIAKGSISAAEKSGRLGKGGKLGIRLDTTTTVDGQRIKLRAAQSKSGGEKTGTTIALVALFGVFGFFKKGSDAKIKPGTRIKVFTDEEKKVRIKGGVI